jgi:hypothetical protein
MGGLLAADTLREFVNSCRDEDPLWPRIIACIGYDTPVGLVIFVWCHTTFNSPRQYFGIHPFVVKHSVTKATEYANAATTVGSVLLGSLAGLGAQKATQTQQLATPQAPQSKWGSAVYAVGGAILAGAVAGGAYYKRDDLTQGLSWATDHMKYVGNLWNEESLNQRVEALIDIEKERGVIFRTLVNISSLSLIRRSTVSSAAYRLYAILPPKPPEFLTSRTFIVLPKYGSRSKDHFLPARNAIAPDEIHGHTGIFSATTNDGYYQLGLTSVKIIQDALMSSRGHVASSPTSSREKGKSPTKEGPRT